MFFVLKVHWLSNYNSCTGSSSPFENAKNWFLKQRLDTNLCQVLIDINYTRDWQLGLKKNFQDSLVKPIMFTTRKIKFSVQDLFNKCEKSALLCRYVHFHLINSQRKSFLFIFVHWFGHWLLYWFVHWFGQVNRQKATLKKNNLFFEKLCCYFIHIFPKSLCNLFTARYLDVRFWDLLYFICLKFNPQYWYLLLRREKMCWFSSYF